MARPLGSPNVKVRRPKPVRISLVSPINRAGRRHASEKAVVSHGVVEVRHAAPAPPPHRLIPSHPSRPVTVQSVEQRQARHAVRIKQHRQRVRAKKIREAQAVDRSQNFHDKQLREITEANYYGKTGKPVVSPPSFGKDVVAHGMSGPKGSVISDLGKGLGKFAKAALDVTGYSGEGAVKHASYVNQTAKSLAHPAKSLKSLINARTGLTVKASADPVGTSLNVPNKLFIQTPRALLEHPEAIGKTAKGLAQLPVAGPAAVVEGLADPVGTGKKVVADYARRYGESNTQFRKRIGKEGATAEVLDAATLASGEGAVLGRGITSAARTIAPESKVARVLTAPRPKLRITGGTVREQELSPSAGRAVAQRAEDRVRARKARRTDKEGRRKGIQPRKGEVVPVFHKRAQRIEVSKVQARRFTAHRAETHREVAHGATRSLARLDKHEKLGVFHGLQYPNVHVEPRAFLERRLVKIKDNPAARREVKLIRTILDAGPEKVFTPRLRQFVEEEVQRAERVGHAGVRDTTAEARVYRPVAAELGVEHPYDALARTTAKDARREQRAAKVSLAKAQRNLARERGRVSVSATPAAKRRLQTAEDNVAQAKIRLKNAVSARDARKNLEQQRPALDAQFLQDVKAKLPEDAPKPVYFQHFPAFSQKADARSPHTTGGTRMAAGPKRSEMTLIQRGEADVRPEAYLQGLRTTIKRKHNWELVREQADRHAYPDPAREDLQAVFGPKRIKPKFTDKQVKRFVENMTVHDWQRYLDHHNLRPEDYALWSPGRLRREQEARVTAQPGNEQAGVDDVTQGVQASFAKADDKSPGLQREKGWRLVPREVYDEIHRTASQGGSFGGRLVEKVQGLQGRMLLGTNPAWLQIQVAANAFLTGFGTRGNLAAFVKAPAFFRALKPEEKQQLDELLGVGVGHGHGSRSHLGAAADGEVVNGLRGLTEGMRFQLTTLHQRVPLFRNVPANPIEALFWLDDKQNRYFKKVVLYSVAKRHAFKDMTREAGVSYRLAHQIADIFTLGPQERMRALMANEKLLEDFADATNRVLGDYSRYTAKERLYLKRYVLFYGFFRYSLKTLFYTLPVHHPIMTAVLGNLARLHVDEVKQLLGGDQAPWAYSRIFLSDKSPVVGGLRKVPVIGGAWQRVPGTNIWSVDLARLNPVSSPVVDVGSEGVKALGGVVSPALQIIEDQRYNQHASTGQAFRVHGKTEYATSIDPVTRGRIALDDALSLAFPYRVAKQATQKGSQSDDSLLGSPRPIRFKTAKAKAKERQRRKAQGSPLDTIVRQLLPLTPRPDFTKQTVQGRKTTSSTSSGSGWGSASRSSGSSGWGTAGR